MCVLREEGQACAQEDGDVRGGDLSKEVQAPEGRHLHLLRGQRQSDREREERGEGFAITRPVSQQHLGGVSRQVNMIAMDDRQGRVV